MELEKKSVALGCLACAASLDAAPPGGEAVADADWACVSAVGVVAAGGRLLLQTIYSIIWAPRLGLVTRYVYAVLRKNGGGNMRRWLEQRSYTQLEVIFFFK